MVSNLSKIAPFCIKDTFAADQSCEFYQQWLSFFQQDEVTKKKYCSKNGGLTGYFPHGAETSIYAQKPDKKQFFHFYANGQNCPDHLLNISRARFDTLADIAQISLGEIAPFLPKDKQHILEMLSDSDRLVMRISYYPEIVDGTHAAEHEDIDLVTILPAATEPGLEFWSDEHGWQPFSINTGGAAVLFGDMMEEATEGFLKSTKHRVSGFDERLSISFFANPSNNVRLSENFTAGQLLQARLEAIGYGANSN